MIFRSLIVIRLICGVPLSTLVADQISNNWLRTAEPIHQDTDMAFQDLHMSAYSYDQTIEC